MSRFTLSAGWGLLLVGLIACGSDGSTFDESVPFGGNSTAGGTAGSRAAGAAGTDTGDTQGQGGGAGSFGLGGSAGTGGKSPTTARTPPTEECKACVRALCVNCPAGDVACEPCSVDPGLCEPEGTGAGRLCACEVKCQQECGESAYCPFAPQAGAAGNGDGIGGSGGQGGSSAPLIMEDCSNGLDDDLDGDIDCDAASCAEVCAQPCLLANRVNVSTELLTLPGLWKGHADEQTPFCALAAQSGPEVVYAVTSAVAGFLRVRVTSTADALLSVRSSCAGSDQFCHNAVGGGGSEELLVPVAAQQTLRVVVGAAQPQELTGFSLEMQVVTAQCPDGVVTPDEECDPQVEGTTGCSDTCRLVDCASAPAVVDDGLVIPSTQGQVTSSVQPSCASLGQQAPEHLYAVRASASGSLQAVLRSQGQDLTLSIRSSCQATGAELACADEAPAGAGAIERVVVPTVQGQTFYLVVEGYDGQPPGLYDLWVRSAPIGCGDGQLGVSEQCDASVSGSPPCTEQCTTPLALPFSEQEPNNQPAQALTLGSAGGDAVGGTIVPAGDVDLYRVEVAEAGVLQAWISDPSDQSCATQGPVGGLLDSELRLRTLDGTLVARNDNSPADGLCSRLAHPVAKGSYLLEVRASSAALDQVFSYVLHATWPQAAPLPLSPGSGRPP